MISARLVGYQIAAILSVSLLAQDSSSKLDAKIQSAICALSKEDVDAVSKMSMARARLYLFQSTAVENAVAEIVRDNTCDIDLLLSKYGIREPELQYAFVRMAILYKIKRKKVCLTEVAKKLQIETVKLRSGSPKPPGKVRNR